MKKVFTLFAAAMLGLCAFAQDDAACPSKLNFSILNADDPAQVEVELQLTNSSLNLNGFNMEVRKEEGSESVQWKKVSRKCFTADGYGHVILARMEDATDEERDDILNEYCDVKQNVKTNDHLVIIEILSTNECRFFPVLEEPTGIGKFYCDFSACEDGDYTITAPATPATCSFSYTGGVEGSRAWTTDEPVTITFSKVGDTITEKGGPEAISEISTDKVNDNRIFDLQGRELSRIPETGIYIQNGKKYVK